MSPEMQQIWNPDLYQDKHNFVWRNAQGLVELLAPQPGETVVDLGCGTGHLTHAIAASGANVLGIDADPAMISTAQQQFPHLRFRVDDACTFRLGAPVDAVFSNATLHWVPEVDRAIACIRAALKPGGRFVAEFGGHGNVATILRAIHTARQQLGFRTSDATPWFFPTIGEYATRLERYGFEVQFATLRDRPTPLEGNNGLENWLRMFAGRFFADLTKAQQAECVSATIAIARPVLHHNDQWFADYRRIRLVAINSPRP